MALRLGPFFLIVAAGTAMAADGIAPRPSATDYPAHVVTGQLAIGAAYVQPAQVKKLFGDDLDKHGYVVFEIGMFPTAGVSTDVSPDDFKLGQGKETSIVRAATSHAVAADIHPEKSQQPTIPGRTHVSTSETIGYQTGPYGRGVYTDTQVSVGGRGNAPPPPPPSASGNSQPELEQQLETVALPETKTAHSVAGYVIFPKPSKDKQAEFELFYFGADGQVSLKLSPKP